MTTAADLRAKANAADAEAAASFERCDTDGFLSQWASGVTAAKNRMEADLLDAGGISTFPGLFNADGERIKAKLIDGKYGLIWAVMDASGDFTGTFIKAFKSGPRSKMAAMGLTEADETAPAKVIMAGGACYTSVRPITIRTDGGCPEDAVIL